MNSCLTSTLDECCNRFAASDSPAINTETLMSRCMGKHSFALMLLAELESSGMPQVDTITLHATAGEPLPAAEVAHSLKGASAILGAESLNRTAAAIEAAGRNGDVSQLMDLIPRLRKEMTDCLSFIETFRNTVV